MTDAFFIKHRVVLGISLLIASAFMINTYTTFSKRRNWGLSLNLFDSIGLSADPFSTSPNVDLFYPAVEHRQCLEGLELSIRMRRGLSVIRGGIGVGKTTISGN